MILIMATSFVEVQAGVKGAATGAGIGATVGHIVGGNDEAWIGAALGAAGGALIESNKRVEKEIEAENMARRYSEESVRMAKPKVAEVSPVEDRRTKKEDTWGMRSKEGIKERMERERENLEAWNSSI